MIALQDRATERTAQPEDVLLQLQADRREERY